MDLLEKELQWAIVAEITDVCDTSGVRMRNLIGLCC